MKERSWSNYRVLLRYTLFQLPGLALLALVLLGLRDWMNLPAWAIWLVLVLWTAKDVVLFPFVRRAYDPSSSGDPSAMVGMRGITKDRLAPSGYIQIRGELWQAVAGKDESPIERGEYVRVREIRGLTLIVQSDEIQST